MKWWEEQLVDEEEFQEEPTLLSATTGTPKARYYKITGDGKQIEISENDVFWGPEK